MTLLLLIVAITLAVLLVVLLVWITRLLAASDVPQDIAGRGSSPRRAGWFRRLRLWLTATPKRLDYRRDKKGRFRRVRRG